MNFRKYLYIKIFIFLLISNALAKNVEESFFIESSDFKIFELLKSRPELTIDHKKNNGFELFGPKGTQEYLRINNIPFQTNIIPHQNIRSAYPSPEEVELDLLNITKQFPLISKLFSIGMSTNKRNLWVVKISKNVNTDDNRPKFKYIANMHGDEIIGREMMVRLIKDLLSNYGKDPLITHLIDSTQIYILPSMNPDGAALARRGNGRNIDLNRDFPDFSTSDNKDTLDGRQPETQAVMKWQSQHQFKLSANFHGGAEVVNYPWDTKPDRFPQEQLIKELCLEYASLTPYIFASTTFENGITNGFHWYEVNGGMQDWSIYYKKDLQITIEVSNTKWPDYSQVEYYYNENRTALLKFIERIL